MTAVESDDSLVGDRLRSAAPEEERSRGCFDGCWSCGQPAIDVLEPEEQQTADAHSQRSSVAGLWQRAEKVSQAQAEGGTRATLHPAVDLIEVSVEAPMA